MFLCLIASASLVAISIWNPLAGAMVLTAILLAQISLMVVRLAAWQQVQAPGKTPEGTEAPIFSVHVATHNEPPQMVIQTLAALAAQTWPREHYEVIVIDNNTSDPELWWPVRRYCDRLGAGFKFLHRDNVQGAKAGALNIALDHSRVDATHIVTVDADYRVIPDFLTIARDALLSSGADYIQFPQAYRMSMETAIGVDAELEEYFRTNITTADNADALLLTGTLSVVSNAALRAVGGWSGVTTTEDAELGLRLCRGGFYGRFISTVVATGLLPLTLKDLECQRHRWASGNLQTLKHYVRDLILPGKSLRAHQRIAIFSQLTAWINLSFMPASVLVFGLLTGVIAQPVLAIASLILLLSASEIFYRILRRGAVARRSWRVILSAIACRLALAPVSATATLDSLLTSRPTPFNVTSKFIDDSARFSDVPLTHLALATAAIFALPAALSLGLTEVCALVLLILPLPAALITRRQLCAYRSAIANSFGGAQA